MMRSLRGAAAAAVVVSAVLVSPGRIGSAQRQQTAHVIGATGLVHGVENLDKSLPYYRDVLGFDVIGSVTEKPTFDIHVQALTNHGGVLYRTALLQIPGSTMTVQLFEGTNGGPNSRSSPRQLTALPTDRGGAVLGFRVPSVAGSFATIASSGQADVISVGGKPAGNALFVRNRDGLVAQLVQSGDAERSNGLNADPASIALVPGDPAVSLRFYRDVLGFDLKTGDWESGKDVMQARGAEMGMLRRNEGDIPGSKIHFELDEYSGFPTKRAFYYYNSMPGAVSLQLLVRDLDDLVRALRAAQVRIVTTGQQPVTLDRSRTVLIRDPDGIFIQLIEREHDQDIDPANVPDVTARR
jgi:catechol 2,3-dioxygenase-like lactoylglutathione lyase family enzyme